jgi:tRNA(Ile)-lysidine synthase TilS/MesJ
MKGKKLKICSRCVLPETFPGIKFDGDDVCNFCLAASDKASQEVIKRGYREKFETLLEEKAGEGDYDILMCFSGGKDSTYTMLLLKNEFNLRILALTMDNGFTSPVALKNIERTVEALGVDHLHFKPNVNLMKKVFAQSAKEVFYSRKSLERASTICTSCITFVKYPALKMAIQRSIPFIGYGWSPGQAPVQSSVLKTNPMFIKAAQASVYNPLYERFGDAISHYFLSEIEFNMTEKFPINVHPLAFLKYDEEEIHARISSIGWQKPDDTDPNSTNCLLNAYANHVHERQFGYNPYSFELAKLVREGLISRDDALSRLAEKLPERYLLNIKKALRIN